MKRQTDGLVIRETPVGEADKFVTILTRSHGVMRAAARGSRKANSRTAAATRLLTHTQFSLQEGKNNWYIDDARPLTVFFSLTDNLERLTLAQYFCELAGVVAPREEPAEEALRLLLNALHYLSSGERPPFLLKAVVEWRLLAGAGYSPDLTQSNGTSETVTFLPQEGRLAHNGGIPLSAGVVDAMRRIQNGSLAAGFGLSLSPEDCALLATVSEAFVKAQLGRGFTTLEFYNTLHS